MSSAPLRRLWKFMNTPVEQLLSADMVTGGVEAAKAVFDLAKALDEGKTQDNRIAALACQIPTLLEVLNSPLGEVVKSAIPFAYIATGLLKFFYDKTKQDPTLGQCAALVVQVAYLDSLKEMLEKDSALLEKLNQKNDSLTLQQEISQLGELEIDDKEARLALVYFHESKLAKAFNAVLAARLKEAGIETAAAEYFASRVAINADRYVTESLVSVGDKVKQLVEWYRVGGREEFEKYFSIDTYLETEIKELPQKPVFAETFTFQQIYIPLKAVPLDENGKKKENVSLFILQDEIKKILQDEKKQNKVIFIEAGPGRGKSVFCRMFADWTRQYLHPKLTPILLRLRDIISFQQSFEKTLTDALSHLDFVSNDSGWLTDRKTQFLFLLDGFDELRLEGRTSGGVERFIQQVCKFQENFPSHRTILTGRSLALQGIPYLPSNLQRVEIQPMDENLQEAWLEKWQVIIESASEIEAFRNFLNAEKCPQSVKDLAKEPLLLYLLAAMHRDGQIKVTDFQEVSPINGKIAIYQKSLDWVLTKQREKEVQYNITGLTEESLRRILAEAGSCVVQSGGEYAKLEMIETRLEKRDAEEIKRLKAKKGGEKALTTALGAFYLREAQQEGGGVEFYHKSFSEFLCAKRILSRFEEWIEPHSRREFDVDEETLAKQLYDLLGYGALTPEIVEYLMGLLIDEWENNPPLTPWKGGNPKFKIRSPPIPS